MDKQQFEQYQGEEDDQFILRGATIEVIDKLNHVFDIYKDFITQGRPFVLQFPCPLSLISSDDHCIAAISHAKLCLSDPNYIVVDAYLKTGEHGKQLVFVVRMFTQAEIITKEMIQFYNKKYRKRYAEKISQEDELLNGYGSKHRSEGMSPISRSQFQKTPSEEFDELPASIASTCSSTCSSSLSNSSNRTEKGLVDSASSASNGDHVIDHDDNEEALRLMIAQYHIAAKTHNFHHTMYSSMGHSDYYTRVPPVDEETLQWLKDTNFRDKAQRILLEDHVEWKMQGQLLKHPVNEPRVYFYDNRVLQLMEVPNVPTKTDVCMHSVEYLRYVCPPE